MSPIVAVYTGVMIVANVAAGVVIVRAVSDRVAGAMKASVTKRAKRPTIHRTGCTACRNYEWSADLEPIMRDGQPHHPKCWTLTKKEPFR